MDETPGLHTDDDGVTRCAWGASDPDYLRYHDEEWGRGVHDDRRLFEKISLEGFQAGLSWLTILRKRPHFRTVFADFDFEVLASWGEADVARLVLDRGIVRHRGKITAVLNNAQRAVALREEAGSIDAFVRRYRPDPASRPSPVTWEALRKMPTTPESTALSKALKQRGWRFVGPTTMYAFMQAMGLVNDHVQGCFARPLCEE